MCKDDCDFAFISFPVVAENRQLELTEPLHFIVDECGNIRTDTSSHGVRNGALACTEGNTQCLEIELKLVLPLSVGCSLITIVAPPVLNVVVDGNINAHRVEVRTDCNTPNVIFYTYFVSDLEERQHCLTSISFGNTIWGKILLGCDCDPHRRICVPSYNYRCQKFACQLRVPTFSGGFSARHTEKRTLHWFSRKPCHSASSVVLQLVFRPAQPPRWGVPGRPGHRSSRTSKKL